MRKDRRSHTRAWYLKNKEKILERNRIWRATNPDKKRISDAKWRAANREECRESGRKWRANNKEKDLAMHRASYERRREVISQRAREARAKLKLEVITAYGGKCACCGETEIDFLSVDHINNDGAEERKRGLSGSYLYATLRRKNWPSKYQVLCFNCNFSKGRFGTCPHQRRQQGRVGPGSEEMR